MKNKKSKIQHWILINIGLIFYDMVVMNLSYLLGLLLRFDFTYSMIPKSYLNTFIKMAPIYTIVAIIIFSLLEMYNSLWRFASVSELFRGVMANIITAILHILISLIIFGRMPISYYIIGAMLQFLLTTSIRFTYRAYIAFMKNRNKEKNNNTLIIGAGEAGRMILHDLRNYNYNVVAFIDDNPNKWGRYINGVQIIGGRQKIYDTVEEYQIETIVIAVPSASAKEIQSILDIAKETNVKLKILPSIEKLISNNSIGVRELKDVQIEDLLERKPIEINSEESFDYIKDKVILVTGGGGTIGSELCRQIASKNPKQLIIFDIYENNAYEIQQELKRKYPNLDLVALIGSVREQLRMDDIFNEYRPNIVYHAAAHKHVPLMEDSPNEAIKNNVFGTYNACYVSLKYQVERFILISTDKAVNPTSVMGATKRICEMIIQNFNKISATKDLKNIPFLDDKNIDNDIKIKNNNFVTEFVAVRFGNVLGSNGSVIPLFKRQIAEGGPVTVTHPEIIRYFMTIQEAVSLVIQAGSFARGGEIFVLDMGSPVKIDTLARNLIKLSGYTPDRDIKVVYSGLRPGEKLYEEKLIAEEGLKKTDNDLIHIAKPIESEYNFFKIIEKLYHLAKDNDVDEILNYISILVPTYHSSESDLKYNKEKFEEYLKESV